MGLPLFGVIHIPNDGATPPLAIVANGAALHLKGTTEKGYEMTLDAGAAFTANLEASVDGNRWEVLAAVATAQGAIAAYYNFIRVAVSAPGAVGPTTTVRFAGKER